MSSPRKASLWIQLMLILKNHLLLKQTCQISRLGVFCHSKEIMRNYISWLSTCVNLTLPKWHDKELLAIVDSFAQWRHFLEGSPHQIIVFSDHERLAYLQNARVLNRRQAWWAQFLTHFGFKITFSPGKQQGKANALSWRSYLAPHLAIPAFDNQMWVILCPTRLQATSVFNTPLDPTLLIQYVKIWRQMSLLKIC